MNSTDTLKVTRRHAIQAVAASAVAATFGTQSQTAIAASAANGIRKGLQLIHLSYWPAASVTRLTNVLTESNAPAAIELTFCPFIDGSSAPPSFFQNARTVVDRLRNTNRTVSLVAYLSFQATGIDFNKAIATRFDDAIATRAKQFADEFASTYASRCILTVAPSLEDMGSTADFVRWVGILKNNIPANLRAKIQLRRSNNLSTSLGSLGNHGFAPNVTTEQHGAKNSNPNVYSNDGNLVYWPDNKESATSLIGGSTPTYALSDFIGYANKSSTTNTVNLWRPAYNHLRSIVENGVVKYTRVERVLGSDSFTTVEQNVARRFLGMA